MTALSQRQPLTATPSQATTPIQEADPHTDVAGIRAAGSSAAGSPAWPHDPRILIVEDSGMARAMLTKLLANVGYRDVLGADSGASAFHLLGLEDGHPGESVDLILMDLILPDTDGIAVIRAIKAREELRNIPILMVTATRDPATLKQAFEAGASDYIPKSAHDVELLARVGSALRLKFEIDRRETYERKLEALTHQLEQLSLTDALTGVANRRHFDQTLRAETNRATRAGIPLALLMIDIDHFKRYNDTYGHQSGDECLQRVAATLALGATRPGDLVARYGGEEFAIVLPHIDLAGAQIVGTRLCTDIAALAIPHRASLVIPVVTLSIGVAAFTPGANADPQALIATADQALYRAKEQGRNRVVALD